MRGHHTQLYCVLTGNGVRQHHSIRFTNGGSNGLLAGGCTATPRCRLPAVRCTGRSAVMRPGPDGGRTVPCAVSGTGLAAGYRHRSVVRATGGLAPPSALHGKAAVSAGHAESGAAVAVRQRRVGEGGGFATGGSPGQSAARYSTGRPRRRPAPARHW